MKVIATIVLIFAASALNTGCQVNRTTQKERDTMKTENTRQQTATDVADGSNAPKGQTIKLTKDEFLSKVVNYEADDSEWKYLGDKPAIIDFYADWCGPCKAIAPILEELADEYAGKIYIYKVNTDREKELAGAFGIRSIPTILFVPMNDKPQMAQGAMPKQEFVKAIEQILLKQ